jgi:alkylation response protein AidB-like acyl-CoA dehydrogenase
MIFKLTDEQRLLRDSAQKYLGDRYPPQRAIGDQGPPDSEVWREFADLGWLGLPFSEDFGGFAGSFEDAAILLDQFGRHLVPLPYLATVLLSGFALEGASTKSAELIPRIIAGDLRLAFAADEPQSPAGSASLAAAAERYGEGYLLSGRKIVVVDGPNAASYVVTAVMEGAPALFLVDGAGAGIFRSDYRLLDGSAASDLEFRRAAVPRDGLLAGGGEAEALIGVLLDRGALAAVAMAIGSMQAILDITRDYVKGRVQFGRPIGSFQAIQHRMADMFVEVDQARSLLLRGISHLGDENIARRQAAISAAKVQAGKAGLYVGGQGIQLHGGYGIAEEFAVAHHFRKQVVLEKLFGDREHHLQRYISATEP